jgi:uncharacterized protein (DUF1501 family)
MTDRRSLLTAGSAFALGLPSLFGRIAHAAEPASSATSTSASPSRGERILVVLEMSGGNDGLNTVVPYTDDRYYKLRPKLGIKPDRVRRIDDRFGFNPGLAGFERMYKDGKLAIVHGCGYEQPSFSHFASMAFWHTAAPNSGEDSGWLGRTADAIRPQGGSGFVVNIDSTQSLAVASRRHVPVVFDDPAQFVRKTLHAQGGLIDEVGPASNASADNNTNTNTNTNTNQRWLRDIAASARESSTTVREAWQKYRTPVDYGIVPVDLPKVASLIDAGFPARLYYVAYRNNAFDTHVHQAELHQRLLTYVADAVQGFMRDMERIGRADDVVLLAFSEFGRRVPENANLGTDHGTAGPMFMAGKRVKGGHYGEPLDLGMLLPDDNLRHTTDFRRSYATAIEGWLGVNDSSALLRGRFEAFPMFT